MKKLFTALLCMCLVMAIAPISIFATPSVGSVARDAASGTIIGQDTAQGKQSQYDNLKINEDETVQACDIYATKESVCEVLLPKTVILSGSAAKQNTGAYMVGVRGDIAGNEEVKISPDPDLLLTTSGKQDLHAVVTQEKQVFSYADGINAENFTLTSGTVDTNLTAGRWSGQFHFNVSSGISKTYLAGQAAKTFAKDMGMRFGENPASHMVRSNIYQSANYGAVLNMECFNVIPIEALGLQPGDTIEIINEAPIMQYRLYTGTDTWHAINSATAAPGKVIEYTIPGQAFGLSISATKDWKTKISSDDLDLQNLKIIKDDTEIDFLSVLAGYAEENRKEDQFPRITAGHNVDALEDQQLFVERYGMKMLDIDITFTKDHIPLTTHDDGKTSIVSPLNPTQYTYQELLDQGYIYNKLETTLAYFQANPFYIYLDCKQATDADIMQYIVPLVERYDMLDYLIIGSEDIQILEGIHAANPSISLYYYAVSKPYVSKNIERFAALKASNTLYISVDKDNYGELQTYAALFDFTCSNLIRCSDAAGFNVNEVVQQMRSNPENYLISSDVPIRSSIIFDRYNSYF